VQGARGFLLAKGAKSPPTRIDFAGALGTPASDFNDHGQTTRTHVNPAAVPDRQPSPMRMPMMKMMMSGLSMAD
jgi:hypothetical protein